MPEKEQIITINEADNETALAISYGALRELGWNIQYAGDIALVAYTPKSWKKNADLVTIIAGSGQLTVKSKMVHGETFDASGKNNKNIQEFIAAFEKVMASATTRQIDLWKDQLPALRDKTQQDIIAEQSQKEEVDKVMNLSKGGKQITYGIIGVNVFVFALMVISGVSIMSPQSIDLLKWGANYGPLTLAGDWWRLITCVFVHIGIIHLSFNMYALYSIGLYLEPMLGKTRYLLAYICTGFIASVTSLWWHKTDIVSAGASGAIFGMYGVFLALLTTNLIPAVVRKALLQSIGIFVAYNLAFGMAAGVDNAAHVGGLISGFIIGYVYFPTLRGEPSSRKIQTVSGLIALATTGLVFMYLHTGINDNALFARKYDSMVEHQDIALAPFNDKQNTDSTLLIKLKEISLPNWQKAKQIVGETEAYNLTANLKSKRQLMKEYIDLRIEQTNLVIRVLGDSTHNYDKEVNEIVERLTEVTGKMNKL